MLLFLVLQKVRPAAGKTVNGSRVASGIQRLVPSCAAGGIASPAHEENVRYKNVRQIRILQVNVAAVVNLHKIPAKNAGMLEGSRQ